MGKSAGSKRTKGTLITLYVSVGDTKVTIENYKDRIKALK